MEHGRACRSKRFSIYGKLGHYQAGADFDFDALVAEAASLDALRQRFGRIDRLGLYKHAEGVIVRDKSVKNDDPLYGQAISKTAAWIKKRLAKKTKTIDFGVLALPIPAADELKELLPSEKHAPVLLPAYLDLWMQTSPAPVVVPDVSLWLHGPKAGPADVQVLWRIDLSEGDLRAAFEAKEGDPAKELPTLIVAAVRPSSLEAISLPFLAARRWLSGDVVVGDISDVEGAVADEDSAPQFNKLALRWKGDESEVISAETLRPGDTIVVPATRGGIRDGCFAPDSTATVGDLAEQAALFGRGQPVLRLTENVLAQWAISLPVDDPQEARSALKGLATWPEQVPWRKVWLEALAQWKTAIIVDAKEPWNVIQAKHIAPGKLRAYLQTDDTVEDGVELTTDDDDSFHAGHPVDLSEHSADVESFARDYAKAAGLPMPFAEDIALAGWLHDVGKADRRFQILLRGGSEIDFFKDETPWAKSAMPPGAKAAHRIAQRRSRYPKGARHEVQSVAMLERHFNVIKAKANDIDLVIHLVASHHGYCRPFAPVVIDDSPIEVELLNHMSKTFGTIDFSPTSSKHELHRLDASLADRF